MPNISEKMQLRAALMSILNKYSSNLQTSSSEINADIEQLKKFVDKDYI